MREFVSEHHSFILNLETNIKSNFNLVNLQRAFEIFVVLEKHQINVIFLPEIFLEYLSLHAQRKGSSVRRIYTRYS